MENLIQIHSVKNMFSHSGCPEDLLESYLQFLQAGGQQVQIVRSEVAAMFQKEMQYCKRRNEEMKGPVTFSNKDKYNTGNSDMGVFIGMEFIQCCFGHGISALVLDVRRVRGEVVEVVVKVGL